MPWNPNSEQNKSMGLNAQPLVGPVESLEDDRWREGLRGELREGAGRAELGGVGGGRG